MLCTVACGVLWLRKTFPLPHKSWKKEKILRKKERKKRIFKRREAREEYPQTDHRPTSTEERNLVPTPQIPEELFLFSDLWRNNLLACLAPYFPGKWLLIKTTQSVVFVFRPAAKFWKRAICASQRWFPGFLGDFCVLLNCTFFLACGHQRRKWLDLCQFCVMRSLSEGTFNFKIMCCDWCTRPEVHVCEVYVRVRNVIWWIR